ncbi:MAG: carbonic anhydrase [Nitrosopumilaceae archaeon]|nr:carbonic anhydrase [Nitrosopumilaceae archaeon]
MAEGKFATSICCMDGRIQLPLIKWVKDNYSVDFVDTVTEPGVDKTVSDNQNLESIKKKVGISINAHKSSLIVVSGHYDCAGNPVSNQEHIEHIKKSVDVIKSWNEDVTVVGVWVNDKWEIETVA